MSRKTPARALVVMLVAVVLLSSCATTGQTAGAGAALGALAGGILGNQSGHALEGALIGAALGGLTGAIVGDIKQRQIATREEVLAEYEAKGLEAPSGPTVELERLDANPANVSYGEEVNVEGEYQVLNTAPGRSASGTLTLIKDGDILQSEPIIVKQEGRDEFSVPLVISEDMYPGLYEVRVEVENQPAKDVDLTAFTVAEA